jgi:DNA replication and repair protein RecF
VRLRSLRTGGWRNLADGEVEFPEAARLNVMYGDNAQGKTNLLEAIYFLSAFRSFRTSQAGELITHGSPRATVSARFSTRELERTLAVQLTRSDSTTRTTVVRTIRVDGKPAERMAKAFGLLSTVLFVPEDLSLLRAAPSARRRFLDLAVSGVDRGYFAQASDFQRVLRHRNAYLRGRVSRGSSTTLLDTYDEQLARTGALVVERRRSVVRQLEPRVRRFFSALHADLEVGIAYRSDTAVNAATSLAQIVAALAQGLAARRASDLRRGHTTFGPQLDDFEVSLGGRPAREHASQGQLRSLVLALKLAELASVEALTSETPVLLLDDVPSELDPSRRRYLFETLESLDCQTFLTVADVAMVPATPRRADFRVRSGSVVLAGA